MGLFVLAWLFGEGLISWRSVSQDHMPPSPRSLLLVSGLFGGLAVLGEYAPARNVAAGFAWAVNLAVLMKALPGSGDTAAIKKGTKPGWASIGAAGNTVIIPDGTNASSSVASPVDASALASIQGAAPITGGSQTGTGAGGPVSTSIAGTSQGNGSAGANQAVAGQVIKVNPQFSGWDSGQQWACLVKLWTQESNWSALATNQGSGAFGIAQSLHGHKHGLGGDEYNASDAEGLTQAQLTAANNGDPAAQIAWGLAYIKDIYGTPCAAWAHEQAHNWY